MPFTPARHPGILHHFAGRLFAFEHTPRAFQPQPQQHPPPHHTLLFLGGLADDISHPSYPSKLPPHLPQTWTVAELHLNSSGQGWTSSALPRDANDVEKAVRYFRSLPGRSRDAGAKIVVMGHSTGAQVCMEYVLGRGASLTAPLVSATAAQLAAGAGAAGTAASSLGADGEARAPRRELVDGIILQGCASDRQGLAAEMGADKLEAAVAGAREWVRRGRGEDILPHEVMGGLLGASPSARRLVSLAEFGGGDDYFSSDLGSGVLDRTFGRLDVPVCCLLSERDEHMPAEVDKLGLLRAWRDAVGRGGVGVWDEASGVVAGASHNFNKSEEGVVADLAARVGAFVGRVESGGAGLAAGKL